MRGIVEIVHIARSKAECCMTIKTTTCLSTVIACTAHSFCAFNVFIVCGGEGIKSAGYYLIEWLWLVEKVAENFMVANS